MKHVSHDNIIQDRKRRFAVTAEDRGWLQQVGWRSVDDVLALTSHDVAAMSQSSDVVRVPIKSELGGPTSVFVKRYLYRRRSQRIKQMFRGTLFGKSRARTEYEFLTEMHRRKVPTVRPIAYGEQRRGAFLWASFVITEGSEGFRSLDIFALNRIRRPHTPRTNRRALATQLGTAIRQMHNAGVRHGGLYWRNILIRHTSDNVFDFVLLDPDTHGRLYASPIPQDGAIADLSEVVASAMALGLGGGLSSLLKAYFDVPQLSTQQRCLVAEVLEQAVPLVPAEQRRMAITEVIEWLRARIANGSRTSSDAHAVESIDDFFAALTSADADPNRLPSSGHTIQFSFTNGADTGSAIERTLLVDNGELKLCAKCETKPDLLIQSDVETWLAVISGQADAFARLRAGRLRVHGDTRLLLSVLESIDEASNAPSPDGAPKNKDGGSTAPLPPTTRPPQPSGRAFGQKYKAGDYANYYSQKYHSSLSRRISNYLEAKMIRRALARIRSRHPFQSVLDCPSGTGRFLPTVATFDASAIAMDTSDAMLSEGRRYYGAFSQTPAPVTGSAFSVPLVDNAVDVVLCSRLLHHIPERDRRVTILKEFARVARVGVVVSFFDSNSYRARKRKRKAMRSGRMGGRHAVSRAECETEAREAGLTLCGMNALLRFHTEITAAAFMLG